MHIRQNYPDRWYRERATEMRDLFGSFGRFLHCIPMDSMKDVDVECREKL